MKLLTGKVVNGKVVLAHAAEELEEGSEVLIVAQDAEGPELTTEQQAELHARIEQIQRGEHITGDELLGRLAERGKQ